MLATFLFHFVSFYRRHVTNIYHNYILTLIIIPKLYLNTVATIDNFLISFIETVKVANCDIFKN